MQKNKLTFRKLNRIYGEFYYLYLNQQRLSTYFIIIDSFKDGNIKFRVTDNIEATQSMFSDLKLAKQKLVDIFNRDEENGQVILPQNISP